MDLPLSDIKIIHADCLDAMSKMESNSIDFIVTDPPYGLHFMGKHWDGRIPAIEYWQEALRVVKPGSMLAAFGGSRTHHHLMLAIEGGGWEIRDVIMWIYGQGFPKSQDIGKAIDKTKGCEREIIGIKPGEESRFNNPVYKKGEGWLRPWMSDPEKIRSHCYESKPSSDLAKTFEGYGTALKPAYEPIILAMKPLDGTYAHNAEKWGVAGINIDESRITTNEKYIRNNKSTSLFCYKFNDITLKSHPKGRWPANVVFDEEAGKMLDEQSQNNVSRFFYCAKSSPSERNKGCANLENKIGSGLNSTIAEDSRTGKIVKQKNNHPTVKPISLMKYIIKLLAPPGKPTLLDPFMGSGSTLIAAKELCINVLGIEKEKEYFQIAEKRLGIN